MHESVLQVTLPFLSAASALLLALLVVARFQRGPVHWGLAASLSALAVAQLGNGIAPAAFVVQRGRGRHRVAGEQSGEPAVSALDRPSWDTSGV